MAFNINDMRAALSGGGARPTLFQVNITNPVNGTADRSMSLMAKAASLPASTIGQIEVPYFGRKIKVPGDRTYAEWTVTVINDEDMSVRNAMESWINAINLPQGNLSILGSNPSNVKSQAQVTQFGRDGRILRVYNFNGLWPTEISEIETNWESNDTIEEFTLTFAYDWWNVSGGTTGNGGGQ